MPRVGNNHGVTGYGGAEAPKKVPEEEVRGKPHVKTKPTKEARVAGQAVPSLKDHRRAAMAERQKIKQLLEEEVKGREVAKNVLGITAEEGAPKRKKETQERASVAAGSAIKTAERLKAEYSEAVGKIRKKKVAEGQAGITQAVWKGVVKAEKGTGKSTRAQRVRFAPPKRRQAPTLSYAEITANLERMKHPKAEGKTDEAPVPLKTATRAQMFDMARKIDAAYTSRHSITRRSTMQPDEEVGDPKDEIILQRTQGGAKKIAFIPESHVLEKFEHIAHALKAADVEPEDVDYVILKDDHFHEFHAHVMLVFSQQLQQLKPKDDASVIERAQTVVPQVLAKFSTVTATPDGTEKIPRKVQKETKLSEKRQLEKLERLPQEIQRAGIKKKREQRKMGEKLERERKFEKKGSKRYEEELSGEKQDERIKPEVAKGG